MNGTDGEGEWSLAPEATKPLDFSRWSNTLCDIPTNGSTSLHKLKAIEVTLLRQQIDRGGQHGVLSAVGGLAPQGGK